RGWGVLDHFTHRGLPGSGLPLLPALRVLLLQGDDHRRLQGPDRGRVAPVAGDLDQDVLAGAALGQARGAGRRGEGVRVAVDAGDVRGGRVVPGAGGELGDAGAQLVGDLDAGQQAAAVVVDPDHVAVGETAGGRVVG